jgi:hypothetical protein
MPKQPKRLSTDEALRRYSVEEGLVGQTPQTPEVLTALIRALIQRITIDNAEVGKVLQISIEGLARFEELVWVPAERERAVVEMDRILTLIARGTIIRSKHIWTTLALQRQYLEDFLRREAFPFKANSLYAQKTWVIDRQQVLLPALRAYRCLCNYPTSFQNYDAGIRRSITAPQAALQILAFLHKTTPASIQKFVKQSQRRISSSPPRDRDSKRRK